ncbi:MAG: site-specific integrase [Gammaproteobacteria bacterium]|jgi:integrase
MSLKFTKLTRTKIRTLSSNQEISEHGITFKRLNNGDGRYAVNIMVDGQRVHRVIGKESEGVTRKQVEDFIEKVRTDARHGRLNLPKGRKVGLSFEEAAKKYLERLPKENGKDLRSKTYRLNLNLVPFFNDTPMVKIDGTHIERYKKHRLDKNIKPGTINRELAALSHLYTKANEWGWIEYRPKITRLKENAGRIIYLTTKQINRLIEIAKNDDNLYIYPFIIIGLETSMRKMEILSTQIKNIDLDKKTIFIPNSKTGARTQPITKHLTIFLRKYINNMQPKSEWLFPANKSKTGHVVNIDKAFRRVVEKANLNPKEIVRHTLRHTAITHLVQAGVDLPTVQRISGHKTLQMVVKYSHQNGEHIQAAMDLLEKRYHEGDRT